MDALKNNQFANLQVDGEQFAIGGTSLTSGDKRNNAARTPSFHTPGVNYADGSRKAGKTMSRVQWGDGQTPHNKMQQTAA